ncbi:MAG TPA: hypothetical protein DCS67_12250 [Clostridiales bacterium UBA8960]|nr:hypothetical protein [Clostridiales bacterium UBA8960]
MGGGLCRSTRAKRRAHKCSLGPRALPFVGLRPMEATAESFSIYVLVASLACRGRGNFFHIFKPIFFCALRGVAKGLV